MRKFRATLTIGYPTADRTEEFEFEDNATQEEIEEEIREWAMSFVEWYCDEVSP